MSLRSKIIRLAYANPELRTDLMPLLEEVRLAKDVDVIEIQDLRKDPRRHDQEDAYMSGEFDQQEFSALRKLQQKGELSDPKKVKED